MTVIVAGGGIAGLAFALTCHELGEDVEVLEAAREIQPLGVGINLQPNAIRELYQLGLEHDLRKIGVEAEEWALSFGLFEGGAHPVWSEPRGSAAGYKWPQFSVHRGQFQQLLLDAVRERLGEDSVTPNARLLSYKNSDQGITAHFTTAEGKTFSRSGTLLVGADGIHSQMRKQMYPSQGDVHWNGAVMWRGVSRCKPPQSKNAFIMVGSLAQRFICYPIEPLDQNGETLLNWIAELRSEDSSSADKSDWNKPAQASVFIDEFSDWDFGWLNVPEIVGKSQGIWEFPMVDRDTVDRWTDGRAVLLGDAAHAMFPHGSAGVSQAIVGARLLGAAIKKFGPTPEATQAFETQFLPGANALAERNRGEGPIGVLIKIEERIATGQSIEASIDEDEIAAYMARYKAAAGIARDTLNESPEIITPTANTLI